MQDELLFKVTKDDFVFETFRAGGKGGQKQNKTDSGVRIRHPQSGARAESRSARGQLENKRLAFQRLVKTPEFQRWLRVTTAEAMLTVQDKERREAAIDAAVDRQMQPHNITTQVQDDEGEWHTVDVDDLAAD